MSGVKTPTLRAIGRAQMQDYIVALAWSPNGKALAAATVSGDLSVFHMPDGTLGWKTSAHHFGATALAWKPDNSILASAGQDGKIRLWDPAQGVERYALDAGSMWAEHLVWHPDSDLLAATAGKKLTLWNGQGAQVRAFPDHASTIADVAWLPKSTQLVTAAYGGLAIWTPEATEPVRRFEWKGSTLVIACSPDGKYVATGDQDSTVHFWTIKTGQDLQMWGYPTKIRELAWDSTSRFLATGGGPEVVIWDCSGKGPENTKPLMLSLHQDFVSALAFQAKGHLLASGGLDGRIGIWKPLNGKRNLGQAVLDAGITQLAWSADNKWLAAGSETGQVCVLAAP